jgi:hypothetical protein
MAKARPDLPTELKRIIDQLTVEIVRAIRDAPIEELGGTKPTTDAAKQALMRELAARMREAGVSRIDVVVRERPRRRRRSSR